MTSDEGTSSRPMSPMEQINLIQAIEWEKTRDLEEPNDEDLEVRELILWRSSSV